MFGPRARHYFHNAMRMRGFGLKYAILSIASDKEVTGADIANIIGERTNGHWVPSPGIIYPTLKTLYEDGYLNMREENGKKYYRTSEKGRSLINEMTSFPGIDNNMGSVISSMENYAQFLLDRKDELGEDDRRRIKELIKQLELL
ncbi:PadR family transcriptional regulator [Picrophilus oshimae]|uniref:Transcriptional regulator n=1 Tax=Picrophilus torridus (strain ATCC 700027 / DSM 9790 / JCM 10055 / NBRC 100828 / KAW 2/3) TaxID=1122961 RepID=Q6KZ78_PICTO|nr:PadR family transcriptional regulator [Picrophilus oshimae]AAT43974.1 transcriptional regulator [Picrophilus oshimae DSM 9789]SMD30954.1 transcriptional regulator, PadR family [Picrophilus oshimae DSM 9789]